MSISGIRLIIFGNGNETYKENIKKKVKLLADEIFFYKKSESFLNENDFQASDIFISVVNPVKIQEPFLSKPNFNIHFAPNWHRGVGGFAYALANKLDKYSIVAHKMIKEFDAGTIYKIAEYKVIPGIFNSLQENSELQSINLIHALVQHYKNCGDFPIEPAIRWEGILHNFNELKENLLKIPEPERSLLEKDYFGTGDNISGYYNNNSTL